MQEYDPFAPEVMADPLSYYRALRDGGRAHRLEQYDAWALPRFDDVWHALQDRELQLDLFDFERAYRQGVFERGDGFAQVRDFALALGQGGIACR